MRHKELRSFLATALKNKMQVLLTGIPGIGKSDAIDQATKDIHADYLCIHASICDPTDAKGLPAMVGGKAEFLPYGDMRQLMDATKPLVVHLEDFGWATIGVQQAFAQLLLRRELGGKRISDHVVFIASTNDTKHMAGVSGLIEPVKSRFQAIINLDFHHDDFSDWLIDHNYAPENVAFARSFPAEVCKFEPSKEMRNSPCPRSVSAMFRWQQMGVKDLEVFSGAAGQGLATQYWSFLDTMNELPAIDAILLAPETAPLPKKPCHKHAVSCALSRRLTPQNWGSVETYLKRMEKMFEISCVVDAARIDQKVKGCPLSHCADLIKWCSKNQKLLS